MKIDFWYSQGGKNKVGEFIKCLPSSAKRKTEAMLDRFEEHGLKLIKNGLIGRVPGYKNLFKFKIRTSNLFIRIFFTIKKEVAYLLHATSKKQNKTLKRDVKKAIKRKKEIIGE